MIQGEIETKSRAGDGIKVGGTWYNEGTPGVFANVEWKQTVQFEAQQEGNRSVVYVAPVVTGQAQPAAKKGGWGGKGGGGRKRTPQEIHGPIVGHNLLIAATILGPGSSVQQLIETGRQLMQASDALLQEVIAQKTQGSTQQPVQQSTGGLPPGQAAQQTLQHQTQQFPQQQQQQTNPYTGTPQPQPAQYAPQGQPQQFNDDIPF